MPATTEGSEPADSHTANAAAIPSALVRLQITPLVLFAILDHHLRRDSTQDRVVGTLLGVRSSSDPSLIHIKNAFPVPHSEKQSPVVELDFQFHENMYALHRKVNPREVVVGWYATKPAGQSVDITEATSIIHSCYRGSVLRQQQGSAGASVHRSDPDSLPLLPAVHLLVDTSLTGSEIGVSAYISSPIGIRVAKGNIFNRVAHEVVSSDTERSGLQVIAEAAKNQKPLSELSVRSEPSLASFGDINTTHLDSDSTSLSKTLHNLSNLFHDLVEFVDHVKKKGQKSVEEEKIGRYLVDTLAALPEPEDLEESMQDRLQSLLMIMYLADLTKFQMDVADHVQLAG